MFLCMCQYIVPCMGSISLCVYVCQLCQLCYVGQNRKKKEAANKEGVDLHKEAGVETCLPLYICYHICYINVCICYYINIYTIYILYYLYIYIYLSKFQFIKKDIFQKNSYISVCSIIFLRLYVYRLGCSVLRKEFDH